MKKIIVLAFSLFIFTGIFSQTTLTYKKNALLPDVSVLSYEFEYVSPGNQGANQIWDFSKIKFNSNIQSSLVNSNSSNIPEDFGKYNLVVTENGFDYYYNYDETDVELKGLSSADISLVYTDPLIKMKYPFTFGDNFKDEFSGHALYKKLTTITFNGNYDVSADANGTLLLPDRTIKNTVRIKTHKTSIEINPCNSIKSEQTNYYWYVEGYRYPILTLNYKIEDNGSENPVITKAGYYNPLQINVFSKEITHKDEQQNIDIALNSYPNPFSEKLNYSYFLRKATVINIELFDFSGKKNTIIVKNQTQDIGYHTGEIDATSLNLARGVYYLRVTYDQKAIVHKIVKI